MFRNSFDQSVISMATSEALDSAGNQQRDDSDHEKRSINMGSCMKRLGRHKGEICPLYTLAHDVISGTNCGTILA